MAVVWTEQIEALAEEKQSLTMSTHKFNPHPPQPSPQHHHLCCCKFASSESSAPTTATAVANTFSPRKHISRPSSIRWSDAGSSSNDEQQQPSQAQQSQWKTNGKTSERSRGEKKTKKRKAKQSSSISSRKEDNSPQTYAGDPDESTYCLCDQVTTFFLKEIKPMFVWFCVGVVFLNPLFLLFF